jgi:RNase H-fold protein (predicted Holliday junction resolvase)
MNARENQEKASSSSCKRILAIDPGRLKCGVAVVNSNDGQPVYQAVIETADLSKTLADMEQRFSPDVIVIGDGTTSAEAAQVVKETSKLPVELVDEKFTSQMARKRYFEHNPPRGLRKLLPISLQTPGKPIDDYVAVILAEKYLAKLES